MSYEVLNLPQRLSVIHRGKALFVIAGAGSGKTRVLTYRVMDLVNSSKHLPSRLFVTTFTNKAAEEMRERLCSLIGEHKAFNLRIGTFHSLCRKLLLDCLESKSKGAFQAPRLLMGGSRYFKSAMWFSQAGIEQKTTRAALQRIEFWKNEGLRPCDIDPKKEFYQKHYEIYEKSKDSNGYIDFDDMLYKAYWVLSDPANAAYLSKAIKRIDHFLIDEGQDLNKIQFMLVKLLAGNNRNITLVFDDWQQIYTFRGARINNLTDFQDWCNPEIVKLVKNYRSTKNIVEAGNKLISNNKDQFEKVLVTDNDEGERNRFIVACNEDEEAEKVFAIIEDLILNENYNLSDFAVIYRTNAQSRALVDVLIQNHVPHKVHSNFGFYDRAEIKDIIAYVRICGNPFQADVDDFVRILNKPSRYLSKNFINQAEDYQIDNNLDTIWEAMVAILNDDNSDLTSQTRTSARKFVTTLTNINTNFMQEFDKKTTGYLIELILKHTGYQEWLEKSDADVEEEADNNKGLNLDSLMVGAKRFSDVDKFLLFIDSMADQQQDDEDDTIHLMTIHKSKGLEFPVTFLIGCSTRLMPHFRLGDDIQEERRCAYVGISRAMDRLYVSSIHGKYGRYNVTVSPFVEEMGFSSSTIKHSINSLSHFY